MSDRIILHADLNNFYASVEIALNPKLRGRPVAVGGSSEARRGIILSGNYEAKAYGVKVGLTVWEAKQKCPSLIIVPPHFEQYLHYSRLFRNILLNYSEQVEPFGIDENWMDVTGSTSLFGSGEEIANTVRERVKSELGLTVSVGVSFNKIFAKLGSDIKKPDATTLITRDNYREIAWPLPASDLLGVGRATQKVLERYGIKTIGDIARTAPKLMKEWLGIRGLFLHSYANGHDNSPVRSVEYETTVKSVGNSTTCPYDLTNEDEVRTVFYTLAEMVSARMRNLGLMARTVQISLRASDLEWFERQGELPYPSIITSELTEEALKLLRRHYRWEKPLRAIGIRGTDLIPINTARQISLFDDGLRRERSEKLEYTLDALRQRFGHRSITRGLLMAGKDLAILNPQTEHLIHPVGYN